ncbi:MAG: hypothetical protein KGK01_10730 [Bradyrhizobium sp.]|uniref:hypothetical protein n=1 Tax=Bradyrhizobium sp. TaxID=376 RepID=UPI001C28BFF9|nr:hypothetical protein [Bradyrhizobium sp.]MBU6461702.1 hypothetical protein [Pseudomonadota bacterium]MDE2069091.1 hypothetical protein [Bradyrhizobium sp.]MDE2242889.1 hypothetical protein [Bradyrhizobium sp.]
MDGRCSRLATDLEFPEGPVAMPDGSVVLVEIPGLRLTRIRPNELVAMDWARSGLPLNFLSK